MSKFKDYTDGIYAYEYCLLGGMRSSGKTLMQKGLLYEKLSEELCCPLEVVFEALKEGIVTIEKLDDYDAIIRPRLYYSDEFKCYKFIWYYGCRTAKLEDYHKTWWLKGERDE